jgi:predicted O-methyltransferase YrrM
VTRPFSSYFEALRFAPPGHRIAIARQSLAAQKARTPSSAEEAEFRSPEEYLETYTRLAALLGAAERSPPPGESEFLQGMRERHGHRSGVIGWTDYYFLTAFVSILSPPRVLEIGTLTGFSAAIIAAALDRRHGRESPAWVDTIDLRPQCLIDETRPTGFEIPELIPELVSRVHLQIPNDSRCVRALAPPNELELVFIDADHRHPRPLLDLLRVAPYVRSGGWIVLHDIQLGTIGRKMAAAGETSPWGTPDGAERLFERWPFRKISGGNIGAVEMPNEKRALVPFALRLMAEPFEIEGGAKEGPKTKRERRALYHSLPDLL